MVADLAAHNPFALLTLIVAPALLTNATSLLALSTSNRFLRAGERMRALAAELEKELTAEEAKWRLTHVTRIENQAMLLLDALRAAYVSLGSFVSASLISIVGAGLASQELRPGAEIAMGIGLTLGFIGAGGIVWASVNLFRATQLSLMNISEEANIVRARAAQRHR
ncbi:MAG: hypothetical protein JWQ44_1172 [Chthoniobacter sp.]|jgi:hypothetical protein|nr:hypothetical protein [Chthoniobacter sp.]